MLLEGGGLATKLVEDAEHLCVEALLGRREEASEAKLVALLIRKAGILIQERIGKNAMVSDSVRPRA